MKRAEEPFLRMTMKLKAHEIAERLRQKADRFFTLLRFQYDLNSFKAINYLRHRVLPFMRQRSWPYGTIAYFAAGIGFAYFPSQILESVLPTEQAVAFFTSAGAMIGGILAIIFSLSALLVVNSAQTLPAGFYSTAAKDRALNWIYFAIAACSALNFGFALTFNSYRHGYLYEEIFLSVIAIEFVFYLVFLFYDRTRRRLNPLSALQQVHMEAVEEIKNMERLAKRLANLFMTNPNPTGQVKPGLALAYSYSQLQPRLPYISQRLSYLLDYHDKLVARQENSSALTALSAAANILGSYLTARKASSLLLPTEYLLTNVSDSQQFLAPQLERMVSIGESYVRSDNDLGITRVIQIFTDLCSVASQVEYAGGSRIDNPIFAQCYGYLSKLTSAICDAKNMEGMFRAAQAYGAIGRLAVNKNLSSDLMGLNRELKKLGFTAIAANQNVVLGVIMESYEAISGQLIADKFFDFEIQIKNLLMSLGDIVKFWLMANKGYQEDFLLGQTKIATVYTTLTDSLIRVARLAETASEDSDRSRWQRMFLDGVDQLYSALRSLSETGKLADHIITDSFAKAISMLSQYCLELAAKPEWNRDQAELLRQAKWYLHLPSFFISSAKKIETNMFFEGLVDAPAKIGLKALELGDDDLAKEAIPIIANMAKGLMSKSDVNPYQPPRIMERAAYLGIYALKLNNIELLALLKTEIKNFETTYKKKYFTDIPEGPVIGLPSPNQLEQETRQLAEQIQDTRFGWELSLDTARDEVAKLFEPDDVTRFADNVWPPSS